jgi:hypothetical protein
LDRRFWRRKQTKNESLGELHACREGRLRERLVTQGETRQFMGGNCDHYEKREMNFRFWFPEATGNETLRRKGSVETVWNVVAFEQYGEAERALGFELG